MAYPWPMRAESPVEAMGGPDGLMGEDVCYYTSNNTTSDPMPKIETFQATPARIGNSRGYRIDAALFQAHPEMLQGTFEAAYLGAGTMLIRPRMGHGGAVSEVLEEGDPVLEAYLAWSDRAMASQPALLRPLTQKEFDVAEALIARVDVDVEHDRLPDDFELP